MSFLNKKTAMPLPPPPMPPMIRGDFEDIRVQQGVSQQFELPFPPSPSTPAMEKEVVFDKTIQAPAPKEVLRLQEQAPIVRIPARTFVAIADYKKIVNETNMIRGRLMTADEYMKRLSELKAEEERSFDRWIKQLEDVERKLAYVDQLIEKAQR